MNRNNKFIPKDINVQNIQIKHVSLTHKYVTSRNNHHRLNTLWQVNILYAKHFLFCNLDYFLLVSMLSFAAVLTKSDGFKIMVDLHSVGEMLKCVSNITMAIKKSLQHSRSPQSVLYISGIFVTAQGCMRNVIQLPGYQRKMSTFTNAL